MQRRKSTVGSLCYESFRDFTAKIRSNRGVSGLIEKLWISHWFDEFHLSDDYKYIEIKNYLETNVVPHKVAVYNAGMRMIKRFGDQFYKFCGDKDQFEYNLFFHDLSKFGTEEHGGYAFYNFKQGKDNPLGGFSFEKAWHNHKMNNPHHPEYWWNISRTGESEPLRIPKVFVAEIVADWIGAGETYGNKIEDWLPGNIHKFTFHEDTAIDLVRILVEMGIDAKISADSKKQLHI